MDDRTFHISGHTFSPTEIICCGQVCSQGRGEQYQTCRTPQKMKKMAKFI